MKRLFALICILLLVAGRGMAQTTYPYVFSVTAGAANTGLASSMIIVIKDSGGTTRISIAGSTVSTGTATAIAEETDAAGASATGTYSTTLTIDASWSLPLSYKVTITGKTGFALRGSILLDRADSVADGFTATAGSKLGNLPNVAAGTSGGVALAGSGGKVAATVAAGDSADLTTLLSRLTSTRAGNLDLLDAAISAVKAKTDNLPASPAAVGSIMKIDLTQTFTPTTAGTLGGAFTAAWTGYGFGKVVITGKPGQANSQLSIYSTDGTTVLKTFSLSSSGTRQ